MNSISAKEAVEGGRTSFGMEDRILSRVKAAGTVGVSAAVVANYLKEKVDDDFIANLQSLMDQGEVSCRPTGNIYRGRMTYRFYADK